MLTILLLPYCYLLYMTGAHIQNIAAPLIVFLWTLQRPSIWCLTTILFLNFTVQVSLISCCSGFDLSTFQYQRIIVTGSYSDWLPVTLGVPQGSVIGPLQFILYIDDLQSVISHSTFKIFADNIALYREIRSSADFLLLQQILTTSVLRQSSGSCV